jgi:prepilin-type N-terminal cleavage/methylation domain-containing protein
MKSRKGYTLVEILVVLAMTTLLASYLLIYNRRTREETALLIEKTKISQVILRAKALAISTYSQTTSTCAWGVHFDYGNGTYSIASYTAPSCSNIPNISGLASSTETYALDRNIVYSSGNLATDILFIPPDPVTLIWTAPSATSTSAYIKITSPDGAASSTIFVTSAGQVTF